MKVIHGGDVYRNQVRLDFSVNINPLGIPKHVCAALHRAVEECEKYPDTDSVELKRAVGIMRSVKEEYLVFGNGASELFMAIVHALKPGKAVIPVPSFYGYEYAAEAAGAETVYVRMKEEDDFALTESLSDVLCEDVDMLFLANPNNPTGRLTDRRDIRRLLELCRRKDICVVLDECFIDFCEKNASMLPEIEDFDNLIVVQAFTKIFSIPGVRLGYLSCSNKELTEKIKRQLPEWNLSVFAQRAGTACAEEPAFIRKSAEYVAKERAFLTESLRKAGISVYEGEADFLLVHSERPLYAELLKKGILIRDCKNFRGLSEGYYRIAVKSRKENEELKKAIGESE